MPLRPARRGRVGVIRAPSRQDRGRRQGRHARPRAGCENRRCRGSRHTRTTAPADLTSTRARRRLAAAENGSGVAGLPAVGRRQRAVSPFAALVPFAVIAIRPSVVAEQNEPTPR